MCSNNRGKVHPFLHGKEFLKDNSCITDERCCLYYHLKPLWMVCKILGLAPISENSQTGDVELKVVSIAFLYSLGLAVLLIYCGSVFIIMRWEVLTGEGTIAFDKKILEMLRLILVLPVVSIPLSSWVDFKHFTNALKEWRGYEELCLKFGRNSTRIQNLRYICYVSVSAAIVYMVISYGIILLIRGPLDDKIWQEHVVYLHCFIVANLQLPYFYCTVELIKIKARDLRRNLKMCLRVPTDDLAMEECRVLLQKLRKVCQSSFDARCRTTGISMLTWSLAMSCSLYGVLNGVIYPEEGTKQAMFIVLCLTISTGYMYLTAQCHVASEEVGKKFMYSLYKSRKNLRAYNPDASLQIKLTSQILALKNTKVTAGGYYVVDKKSYVSMMTFVTTNLLILLQFRNSSSEFQKTRTEDIFLSTANSTFL